ncbi:hypothetical protein ACCO45_012683 [Purpureocillium lilacinum]|uniref:Uncharacterized protein n=1 Tax=Purpureocillium lilacinum TaxID=33203 RepID=A0ACC4D8N2_PURLI
MATRPCVPLSWLRVAIAPPSAGRDCRSALWHAAENGLEAVVRLLLNHGAAIDVAGKDGRMPRVSETGHETIVRLLLDRDAAMDAADKDGRAALSHAAENWHGAVVRLLFDRGAAIDAGDKDGRTPLSYAAGDRHKVVLQLLNLRGAKSSTISPCSPSVSPSSSDEVAGSIAQAMAASGKKNPTRGLPTLR